MPDIRSGIETGAEESALDVNSDAGFNARLAAKVAGEEGVSDEAKAAIARLAESDADVQGGLTYGEESHPRDEHGRFIPKEEPVAEAEEEEGAAPADEEREQEVQEPDWKVQAQELEKVLGRQGEELGETRRQNQEYAERLARLEGRMEATPTAQPVQYDPEQLEERIAGPNGDGFGGEAAWEWAANIGDKDLLRAVAEKWGEYQPFHAATRWNDFERFLDQYEREAQKPEPPKPDETLEAIRTERQFNESLNAVKATKEPKDWDLVSPHFSEALEESDVFIQEAIVSPDPEIQKQGMNTLYSLAKARVVEQATTQVANEVQAEKVVAKKAASIATGSLRPAKERQPESPEVSREEAIARFKASIMEAETASVAEGLTYEVDLKQR
jgi:hypothetical protein